MSEETLVDAFVRGFSKPLILLLIFSKPMNGYSLMSEFKKITGKGLKPNVVYPFLHSLEAGGYIVGTWIEKGKRRVKLYRLTSKGETLLKLVRKRLATPLRDIIYDLMKRKG